MAITTYEGLNCTAVLDTDQDVVSLTHHKALTVPKHKVSSSPWLIPLGAIIDIEAKEKSMTSRGSVRFLVRDQVGWDAAEMNDVNAFFAGKQKVTPFVEAVNTARTTATPAAMPGQIVGETVQSKLERWQGRAEAKAQATTARKNAHKTVMTLGATIDGQVLRYENQEFPLAGARATVEVGAARKRVSATRVVLIGVFALAAKKDTSKVFVTIELADGQVVLIDTDAKNETTAREFTARINTIAGSMQTASVGQSGPGRTPSTVTPPPPSVPAGWYPDPQSPTLQRYWDGGQWTEHTAPRA